MNDADSLLTTKQTYILKLGIINRNMHSSPLGFSHSTVTPITTGKSTVHEFGLQNSHKCER